MKAGFVVRSLALAGTGTLAGVAGFEEGIAGGGGCHAQQPTEGSGTSVEIDDTGCFTPMVLRVEPGATVVFTNAQGGAHDVAGLDWGMWRGGTTALMQDDSFEHRFTAEGYYPYSCTLHVNMVGVVVVGEPEGPETTAASTSPAGANDGGMTATAWSLIAAGGMAAVGMIGGGAMLGLRRRRP